MSPREGLAGSDLLTEPTSEAAPAATGATLPPWAGPPQQPARRHLPRFRDPGSWWAEAALLVGMDQLYELVRSLAPRQVPHAFANAHTIERVEAALHLNPEKSLNHGLEHLPNLIPLASVYYQVGHLLALLATLIWAWNRRRDHFAPARTALLTLSLTALVTYWLIPTAPPRFATSGVLDTIATHPILLASNGSVTGLVNLYAAMPSLHVGWAVWVALTVNSRSDSPRRGWIWLHPLATTLVVLATANHYLLDALAGAALALLTWHLARGAVSGESLRRLTRAASGGPRWRVDQASGPKK